MRDTNRRHDPGAAAPGDARLVMPGKFRDLSRLPLSLRRAYEHSFLVKDLPRIARMRNSMAVLDAQMVF